MSRVLRCARARAVLLCALLSVAFVHPWARCEAGEAGPLGDVDPSEQHAEVLDALYEVGALDEAQYEAARKKVSRNLSTAVRPTVELLATYTPMNQMPFDEVRTYPGGPERERGFAIRKTAFGFQGRLFWSWLRFKLTAAAEQNNDGTLDFGLENAYLQALYSPGFLQAHGFGMAVGAHAGAMKIPFSRQLLCKEARMQFIDRAVVLEEVEVYRDVGATLDTRMHLGGETATLWVRGGAFNGQGYKVYKADNNDQLLFVVRSRLDLLSPMASGESDLRPGNLLWDPLRGAGSLETPQISLGASFFQNNDIDRTVRSWGVDGAFRWMGFSLQGEYVSTEDDLDVSPITPDPPFDTKDQEGWYVQGGFFVWPQIVEIALRYEEYEREVESSMQGKQKFALTTVGLNVHLATRYRLRFMTNYIHRAELEGFPATDNDSVTLMVSMLF